MSLTAAQSLRIANVAREVAFRAPMALATSFGSTVSGTDGGYAAPSDMAKSILMDAVGALLPLCAELPVTRGGSIGVPLDALTPYGSGITAAWEVEADQHDQQKPNLNLDFLELKKMVALVPVTDELLDDSATMAAWLPLALQTACTLKVNEAIVNGTGAGVPLGILKSGCTITVAKEGAQTAGTIVDGNIGTMLERSLSPLTSTWVANPEAYGQIITLASFDGASRTLAGLPIVLTEACPAVGTAGDLILADMGRYLAATKTPQLNGSMHLWFDQDMTAFKLVFRMDGQPMLGAPVTPPNSSATKSHFVTVATRA